MNNMTNKRLKIYILSSIVALSIIFSSFTFVQAEITDNYSPSVIDLSCIFCETKK